MVKEELPAYLTHEEWVIFYKSIIQDCSEKDAEELAEISMVEQARFKRELSEVGLKLVAERIK